MKYDKVLIYRLGSLGDTVVALPCLHLICRAFPDAERRVLTNFSNGGKEVPFENVVGGSGLVHGYFRYPVGSRNPEKLWSLMQAIQAWAPDLLIYLAEPRTVFSIYRDVMFFLACGIQSMIGVPYSGELRKPRKLPNEDRLESEASRLARCIRKLGDACVERIENWDLRLGEDEKNASEELVPPDGNPFLAASVGSKVHAKDWGEDNWASLLARVSERFPDMGLVFIGSEDERGRCEIVAGGWNGPKRNLCGLASPRVSAAVLGRAALFLGHDGGPMHLAAANGVPCVAVFSAREQPGVWFPFGADNIVVYHRTDCRGCRLERCLEHEKKCIASITVGEVFDAVCRQMDRRAARVR